MPADKFGFKLDVLLKVRRQQRDQQQRLLAEKLRRLGVLQQRLVSLTELRAEHLSRAGELAAQPHLDVAELSRQRYWTVHLQKGMLETEAQIRALSQKAADDRRALVEADRRLKAIEKMREKAVYQYERRQQRLLILEADELSLSRFITADDEVGERVPSC